LHHHAPRGGLRVHKARVITYASSRRRIFHRHLLSISEFYLSKRYFSPRQVSELIWINVLGTFSLRGPRWKRILKVLVSFGLLPHSLFVLSSRQKKAEQLLEMYPKILDLEK
jgi:hypothetical protein